MSHPVEGSRIDVLWTPHKADGTVVAPSGVTVTVKAPDGTTTTPTVSGPDSDGAYSISFLTTMGGNYTCRVESTGTYEGAGEFVIPIMSSRVE